ncbi:MAG: tetratricopeptide repeat protein [Salibacteraceae bacterium]
MGISKWFVCLAIFIASVGFNSMCAAESSVINKLHLVGIDDVEFPNDSSMLMNSLLIDYQVDYDIALANSQPKNIAISLHKIGLVYYHLQEYDLATNYAWRLLNVSNKHNFKSQILFGYALLYRINIEQGDLKKAKLFYAKYENLFDQSSPQEYARQPVFSNLEIEDEKPEEVEIEKVDSTSALPAVVIDEVKVKTSAIEFNYFVFSLALILVIIGLLVWKKGILFQRNVIVLSDGKQNQEKKNFKHPVSNHKYVNDIDNAATVLVENNKVLKDSIGHKEKTDSISSNPNSVIIKTRSKKRNLAKLPAWVSNISEREKWTVNLDGDLEVIASNDLEFIKYFLQAVPSVCSLLSPLESVVVSLVINLKGVVVLILITGSDINPHSSDLTELLQKVKTKAIANQFLFNDEKVSNRTKKITLKKYLKA